MNKQSITEFHKSCAIVYNGIPGEKRRINPMLNIQDDTTPADVIEVLNLMGHLNGIRDKAKQCLEKNDKMLDTLLVLKSFMSGALDISRSKLEREALAVEFFREMNKSFPCSWELL